MYMSLPCLWKKPFSTLSASPLGCWVPYGAFCEVLVMCAPLISAWVGAPSSPKP
jgi:hypothetical protein